MEGKYFIKIFASETRRRTRGELLRYIAPPRNEKSAQRRRRRKKNFSAKGEGVTFSGILVAGRLFTLRTNQNVKNVRHFLKFLNQFYTKNCSKYVIFWGKKRIVNVVTIFSFRMVFWVKKFPECIIYIKVLRFKNHFFNQKSSFFLIK